MRNRDDSDSTVRRRRVRHRGINPLPLIAVGLVLVAIGGLTVLLVTRGRDRGGRPAVAAAAGESERPRPTANEKSAAADPEKRPEPPEKRPEPPEPVIASPKPTPKRTESPVPESAKPPVKPTVPKKPQPKKSPPTFDEDYAIAEKMADSLAKEEPEKTRKAMAVLTQGELVTAQFAMADPTGSRLFENYQSLVRLDLGVWVAVTSGKVAKADPGFKVVSRAFWEPSKGPRAVLGMMNVWGCLNPLIRQMVVDAVKNDRPSRALPPECRDAILAIGGKKWLER